VCVVSIRSALVCTCDVPPASHERLSNGWRTY
jgi:hypothetical protein